jgi:phage internal scaffolding protein
MSGLPFLRTPYNYDRNKASDESGIACLLEEGRTQQEFKDECDINVIMERFGRTGELPDDYRAPVSGDFTGITDFHSAMNAVRQAQESFNELPAELRARFNFDPQRLIEFCEDGQNLAEARKLGLVAMPVEQPRDVVKAVDELAAKLVPPVVK